MPLITRQGILFSLFVFLFAWIGFLLRLFVQPGPGLSPVAIPAMPATVLKVIKEPPPETDTERMEEHHESEHLNAPFENEKEPSLREDILDSPMPDLDDLTMNARCPHAGIFKDSDMNGKFLHKFTKIFKKLNLSWWLDEGGLIGVSRAGSMTNADDDFDFFCLLPSQRHPCGPTSHTCSPGAEFNTYIHKFLMNFWNDGMCINKFHPNQKEFKSNNRLMYSLQLDRSYRGEGETCFDPKAPFAHMHLGMMTEDGNHLHTNVWAGHTTHPQDKLPLVDILPVARCRSGKWDAPCPKNMTNYLTVRNRGEYRKKSSDGNCLLVRRQWGLNRKKIAVDVVQKLDACGYNSVVDLLPAFVQSNYTNC